MEPSSNNNNQVDPNTFLAFLQEALSLHQEGRSREARKKYESLLRQNPTHPDSLNLFGLLELEEEDEETRREAALHKLRVHHAIVTLENARLRNIRDKLVENEVALEEGRQHLIAARQSLEDAKVVVEALGNFLQVVGRIAALII